jgi:hypothetical protein
MVHPRVSLAGMVRNVNVIDGELYCPCLSAIQSFDIHETSQVVVICQNLNGVINPSR